VADPRDCDKQHALLRDYIDAQDQALDRRIVDLDRNVKRAVETAAASLGHRLDAMNEFRGALSDLASKAATRDQLDALKEKVSDVKQHQAVTAALVALLVSVLVTIAGKWIVP
jgi:S-adenosylmethionine:diacylglycerol 3-amino-3-carboxypropyl transferase